MRFWPRTEFQIYTTQTKDDVLLALKSCTEPGDVLPVRRYIGNKKDYIGNIAADDFEIMRISYAFDPNFAYASIKGTFTIQDKDTIVNVLMALHTIVAAVFVLWLCACAVLFAVFLFSAHGGAFDIKVIVPFFLMIFGYGFIRIGFWYETKRTKKQLVQTFGGVCA